MAIRVFLLAGFGLVCYMYVIMLTLTTVASHPDCDTEDLANLEGAHRCQCILRNLHQSLERWSVLPGLGWDNLRNLEQRRVVTFTFNQCRTTDDGRFLLPDGFIVVSIKSSEILKDAGIIDHWKYWKSLGAQSINLDVSFGFPKFLEVSGKYSSDFLDVKETQLRERVITVMAMIKYWRYVVQLQQDVNLDPAFRNRLLDIAAAHEMNDTDQARFLSQQLVRDYGTHVITKIDVGAALVQIDQLREEWVRSQRNKSSEIKASAKLSLLKVLNWDSSLSSMTQQQRAAIDDYRSHRVSSYLSTMGGPPFRPANFTPEQWSRDVERNMVALDRWGQPLHFLVTRRALPELPIDTLNKVADSVREAEVAYYAFNYVPGCTEKGSPNFNPAANADDGSCQSPTSNLTFGGVYQTCTGAHQLCSTYRQNNPKTGGYSCPDRYQEVKLGEGSLVSSYVERECTSCGFLWLSTCCKDQTRHLYATYQMFWCTTLDPVPANTGYMFGGHYTSETVNPVTRSRACPPEFTSIPLGYGMDLHICVTDDYERGAEHAVPFAGFISCSAGNPLALTGNTANDQFENGNVADWPHLCPPGYSKHIATMDRSCEIQYCAQIDISLEQGLPSVNRPPFMQKPPLSGPPEEDYVFDPRQR
ncbi:hypothetical protein BaRGS_00036703, partial [Batillaria attramentaria]